MEALLTIRKVELVGKKEFLTAALDLKDETFAVHIAFIASSNSDPICLSYHS